MEAERIGKKKWRSFKIRWGFIYCCAKPLPPCMAPHDTMAVNKNHDDDVYEILPALEQEEPIARMLTKEETREAVEEAEMPLTRYSTISSMLEEEEENKKSEEMAVYSTLLSFTGEDEEENKKSEEMAGYSTLLSFTGEEEENKEGEGMLRCGKCQGRPRGAALIQCGHTFCRLCAREMWLTQFDCPLCHRPIHGILDIF